MIRRHLVFSACLVLAAVFLHPRIVSSQASDPQDDTLRLPMHRVLPIPVLFYTPETKLAGGISVMYYFRSHPRQIIPSLLAPTFIYTQRRQIISELMGDTYLSDGLYRLSGNIHFVRFPNTFYGIGNDPAMQVQEDFTPERVGVDLAGQRLLSRHVRAGLNYLFTRHRVLALEPDGMLDGGTVPGVEAGLTSGAGVSASWDSRDNAMSPYRGAFHQASAMVFSGIAGSDYDFIRLRADLRRYIPTAPRHVLALQLYTQVAAGDVPFYHMAQLGGQNLMRGYVAGSFRDRNMIVAQAEYRMPVWWRFGVVGFAGFGDVWGDGGDFSLDRLKYSVGGGARFMLDDADRMSFRIDYGVGENTSGWYFTVTEAF